MSKNKGKTNQDHNQQLETKQDPIISKRMQTNERLTNQRHLCTKKEVND